MPFYACYCASRPLVTCEIRTGRIDRTIFHAKQQRNNEKKKERKKSQPNAKQKTAVRYSPVIF